MIGRLTGVLLEKQAPDLVIDVNGVGYEVQVPMSTLYQLPEVGHAVKLFTHFVVREDAQLLFAFYSRDERSLFRSLIKVNGVGPKLALAILSGIDIADFVRCVHDNDTVSLVKLPGVGKKTAERLIIEMRDRLQDWQPQLSIAAPVPSEVAQSPQDAIVAEAESALQALGYKPQEAAKAVAKVISDDLTSSEALIRAALKNMVG